MEHEPTPVLDLLRDPIALTEQLVNIPSPSGDEKEIADAIESSLRSLNLPGVEVIRFNDNVLARTNRNLQQRVILAGHVDTVPIADNLPSHRALNSENQDTLFGCGTVDMKSGLAVYLHIFARLCHRATRDLTFIAYEGEEVSGDRNGLGHIQREHPDWLEGDLALLGEPTGGWIEAGCQGSLRIRVTAHGTRAHSARSWLGDNAIHKLAPLISHIADYQPRNVTIDGLTYREGLNIVGMESGVANNVIPDEAWMNINFRFAPDRNVDEATTHVVETLGLDSLEGITWSLDDAVPGALPGVGVAGALGGGKVRAKYGWTDVARFSALGIPAVNFGAGDPSYAHKRDEQCPVHQITQVAEMLHTYLST